MTKEEVLAVIINRVGYLVANVPVPFHAGEPCPIFSCEMAQGPEVVEQPFLVIAATDQADAEKNRRIGCEAMGEPYNEGIWPYRYFVRIITD